MKLGSSIVTFTIVMVALIMTLVLSFVLPLGQIIAIPLFIIGSWFIVLGITQEAKPHELMITTPATYTIYGGVMLTISATYLAYINIPDFRVFLLVFILGITLTVILSHFVENRKKRLS